jgi:dTDP-4-amino-4,6-dideoxygalactose transaminase
LKKGWHPLKKDGILFYDLQRITNLHAGSIKAAVGRVIDSGWFLLGKEVESFERNYAAYIGTKHCVGVGNGLDALRLILRAYKEQGTLHEGDEIIVPANTYIATILAITDNSLTPVLVEPDPSTLQLNHRNLEAALTKKTKAVMLVHLYGQNAWNEAIEAFCNQQDLLLLEDNAQAAGAVVKTQAGRKKTGSLGHAAAHSFYPTKTLGALGDAGAVTTNDKQLAQTIRSLANYGSDRKYSFPYQGYNSRLDEIHAAVLVDKLTYLDNENERRRSIARHYQRSLKNPAIQLPALSTGEDNVWHLFPVVVKTATLRDELQQHLAANGIQTQVHYPIPPHKQTCYREWNTRTYPITEAIHTGELSLPISPVMMEEDVERVIEAVNNWKPAAPVKPAAPAPNKSTLA